jgi:predicted MFS family arabinose efflux permease
VVARENLNAGVGGFGVMMSAMGVGMLAGVVGVGGLGQRFNRMGLGVAGVVLAGLAVMVLPRITQFYPALSLTALVGLGIVTVQVSGQTALQAAPEALRGRVMGIAQALMGGAQFLATALAGFLAERVGAEAVLAGVGLLALFAGGAILIHLHSRRQ